MPPAGPELLITRAPLLRCWPDALAKVFRLGAAGDWANADVLAARPACAGVTGGRQYFEGLAIGC